MNTNETVLTATSEKFAICFEKANAECTDHEYHLLGGENVILYASRKEAQDALYNLPNIVGYFVMNVSKTPQVGVFSEEAKRQLGIATTTPQEWVVRDWTDQDGYGHCAIPIEGAPESFPSEKEGKDWLKANNYTDDAWYNCCKKEVADWHAPKAPLLYGSGQLLA